MKKHGILHSKTERKIRIYIGIWWKKKLESF